MEIRPERAGDADIIRGLTKVAFERMPFSDQTEAELVGALREANALTLSLVATDGSKIVGHVAFSPVTINSEQSDWYALGPVSVWPDHQKSGIGQALIRDGLERLKRLGAGGCVLVGNPRYYSRFGFAFDPGLKCTGAHAQYFQRLVLNGPPRTGVVQFHPAFGDG